MSSVYVLSKMSMPVAYCVYEQRDRNSGAVPTARNPVVGDVPLLRRKIFIHGGAGIPSTRSGFGERIHDQNGQPLWVADGVVTAISESDWEILKEHELFKKHMERGQVKVINQDIRDNHRKVAKEAAGLTNDPFAMMTPERMTKRYAQTKNITASTGSVEESEKRN
ncbi:hypothetical protein KYLE_36 [Pantoea phage Kyle]|uniref:Uncharacterized protein n=1 Tax=Pantoea phage Kyle TaxID=2589665 RepID=A0A514A8M8_9CAUD|nr:hypothetical protein HWC52_gp036 [Pantoea phage Kyle]QDH49617.1 hypothetical protein KYLE_36 [Pantoea phage Kyle]